MEFAIVSNPTGRRDAAKSSRRREKSTYSKSLAALAEADSIIGEAASSGRSAILTHKAAIRVVF